MSEADFGRLFVGIDVSLGALDVAFHPEGRVFRADNSPRGVAGVVRMIERRRSRLRLIVFEATGKLHRALARRLEEKRLPFFIANPRRIRKFADADARLAKTDPVDALLCARYGEATNPKPRLLPDPQTQHLAELVLRHFQLTDIRTQEKNRAFGAEPALKSSHALLVAALNAQIEAVDDEIARQIEARDDWRTRAALLRTAPGVGKTCAAALIALLPELGTLDRRQIAALAGLAPFVQQSGVWRGKAKIFGGRAQIRSLLYMAAVTAVRVNPRLARIQARLIKKGRPFKLAIVAVMRRLLVALNAMARDNQPWVSRVTPRAAEKPVESKKETPHALRPSRPAPLAPAAGPIRRVAASVRKKADPATPRRKRPRATPPPA